MVGSSSEGLSPKLFSLPSIPHFFPAVSHTASLLSHLLLKSGKKGAAWAVRVYHDVKVELKPIRTRKMDMGSGQTVKFLMSRRSSPSCVLV